MAIIPTNTPLNRTQEAERRINPYKVPIPPLPSPFPIDVIMLTGKAKADAEMYGKEDFKPRLELYESKYPYECKQRRRDIRMRVRIEDPCRTAKIMSICVGIFGGLGSLGWLAGPLGGAPGTTLGILSGMGLGAIISKHCINNEIEVEITSSDHYRKWRSEEIATKVYPVLKSYPVKNYQRNGYEVFNEFYCLISHNVCAIPMITPSGEIFNLEDIREHAKSRGKKDDEKFESPAGTKNFFSINDLKFDYDYCKKLIEKAERVYRNVECYGEKNKDKYGAEAVIKNTKELMERIRVEVKKNLFKLMNRRCLREK